MGDNKLKEILEAEGLKQSEFAEKCGASVGTVNRTCNSKRLPSVTYRNRMVKALCELSGNHYEYQDVFPDD